MKHDLSLLLSLLFAISSLTTVAQSPRRNVGHTTFQVGQPYRPTMQVNADAAIVYGTAGNPTEGRMGLTFEQRLASWREQGYDTHFMTGIAWGAYQDYFLGQWDGSTHWDEGQMTQAGDTCWHGRFVPYIVPTQGYLEYFKQQHIRRVIDAGVDVIYLEEPEFWAYAGYSESFRREWEDYYHAPWQPQHTSANATYLSNKLKYHLYYRALDECFSYAKAYGRERGREVRCYVPTHSLLNYSQWHIVSPEASLASLDCVDGYIAQVWTGTSRCPNFYNGLRADRIFENAFLEYGCLESMTRPTGRRVYFLTDPIEDAVHDWADYKYGYEATYTAKMLYPHNNYYEVMPWPDRIYERLYPVSPDGHFQGKIEDFDTNGKPGLMRIPRAYSTQMQVMIDAEGRMPLSDEAVSGSQGIYVMMANSLMFQRSLEPVEGYEDPQLAGFHGLALPLLKRGIPVQTMHLENTPYADNWKDARMVLMTYYNMKPMDAAAHGHIADWVCQGGILVFAGRDDDPYQSVDEWWRAEGYDHPSQHLFETLGLPRDAESGTYACGKGRVCVIRQNPGEFVLNEGGDTAFFAQLDALYGGLEQKNHFTLRRGAYLIASVMDESVSDVPLTLKGHYIDLFDPALPVIRRKEVVPGHQAFLLDLDRLDTAPCVLAASTGVGEETVISDSYSFLMRGPEETTALLRLFLPAPPHTVTVTDADGTPVTGVQHDWDAASRTLRLECDNAAAGRRVRVEW